MRTSVSTNTLVDHQRSRMIALLQRLAPVEGLHATILDGVHVRRADRRIRRTPVMYEPCVYFVASGRKRGYIGERRLVYDANHYLVLSAPLPFECETDAADDGRLLAFSVRMDAAVVGELAETTVQTPASSGADSAACVQATPLDAVLADAALRLLTCLQSPAEAAVLGPGLKREIAYRVLCGPRGSTLLAMLGHGSDAARVHRLLGRLHERYAEPLRVATLAREAGMSVSALHHQFKAVTSTSPVQYLKAIRLHKARQLMRYDGAGVATAAAQVGYESASQFSREFKRLFGSSPAHDTKRARTLRLVQA